MKDNNEIETLILDKELEKKYMDERQKITKNVNNKLKKKKRFKRFIYYTILLIAVSVFAYSAYKVGIWIYENYKNFVASNQVKDIASLTTSDQGEEINPPTDKNDSYWKYFNLPLINAKFNKLVKRNTDTVAWIEIPGTNISYPVVQTKNNSYYLTHDFDKNYNSAGWIFSDYRNNLSDLNNNSIIYGHGRLDGSMFGSLKNVFNDDWLSNKNNYIIYLSTPEDNTLWQIFSAYSIKAESYYITSEFVDDDEYQKFIDTITNRSVNDFNVKVNTNDKIITLSTCKNDYGDRIVVHAKLIKKEKRTD